MQNQKPIVLTYVWVLRCLRQHVLMTINTYHVDVLTIVLYITRRNKQYVLHSQWNLLDKDGNPFYKRRARRT